MGKLPIVFKCQPAPTTTAFATTIEHTFQRRAAASLLSGRGALLPTAAESPSSKGDDFDLVIWLVILAP